MHFEGLPIPIWARFSITVTFDLIDMTFGRLLLGVSIFGEVGSALINFLLWGPIGLLSIFEVIDITEQVDGFIPSNTLVAWAAYKRQAQALEAR